MAVVIAGQKFYTAQETYAILRITPSTLYAYLHRGLVHSYRQGRARRRLYGSSEVDTLRMLATEDRCPSHGTEIPLAESWIPYTG